MTAEPNKDIAASISILCPLLAEPFVVRPGLILTFVAGGGEKSGCFLTLTDFP